jgi:cytochrome c553
MRTQVVRLCAVVVSSFVIGQATAEDFAYCMVCHGATGNGNIAIRAPKIAGMEPWYIARQLESFANGIRGGHPEDRSGQEMQPIGVRLERENTVDAAVRFARSLKPEEVAPTIHGDPERGRALYVTCGGCHGARAEGNSTLQAPALASRSDWYLVKQLENYRLGLRGADPRDEYGTQMRAIALTLPDEQASVDVIAYINALK